MGGIRKENALLDFGLYMENKTYNDVDMAILKQMNVQATQTHYIYQCGDVELYLDFVSPSLLLEQCLMGCPVVLFLIKFILANQKFMM